MGITEKQKELRKNHIGSSDMAAILGIDPWKSGYDVWLEKTGRLSTLEENDAMRAGSLLEGSVLEFGAEELGKLIQNQYRSAPDLYLGANIDALVISTGVPVEAKTAGIYGGNTKDEWGEPGTDEVPERVIIQCHVHMLCSERNLCHVPTLLGGRGFVMFRVEKSGDLSELISEAAVRFWEKNVQADTPPERTVPSMESCKRMLRQRKRVEIDPTLYFAWCCAKFELKKAEKKEEAAKCELLAALGDSEEAEINSATADRILLTYYETVRENLDRKKLREDHPEIIEKYLSFSSYRTLREKKIK